MSDVQQPAEAETSRSRWRLLCMSGCVRLRLALFSLIVLALCSPWLYIAEWSLHLLGIWSLGLALTALYKPCRGASWAVGLGLILASLPSVLMHVQLSSVDAGQHADEQLAELWWLPSGVDSAEGLAHMQAAQQLKTVFYLSSYEDCQEKLGNWKAVSGLQWHIVKAPRSAESGALDSQPSLLVGHRGRHRLPFKTLYFNHNEQDAGTPVFDQSLGDWPYLFNEEVSVAIHFAPSLRRATFFREFVGLRQSLAQQHRACLVILEPGIHPHSGQMRPWFSEQFIPVVNDGLIWPMESTTSLLYDSAEIAIQQREYLVGEQGPVELIRFVGFD